VGYHKLILTLWAFSKVSLDACPVQSELLIMLHVVANVAQHHKGLCGMTFDRSVESKVVPTSQSINIQTARLHIRHDFYTFRLKA
jgi:hypothetical protein